jgi:hypothetical protein
MLTSTHNLSDYLFAPSPSTTHISPSTTAPIASAGPHPPRRSSIQNTQDQTPYPQNPHPSPPRIFTLSFRLFSPLSSSLHLHTVVNFAVLETSWVPLLQIYNPSAGNSSLWFGGTSSIASKGTIRHSATFEHPPKKSTRTNTEGNKTKAHTRPPLSFPYPTSKLALLKNKTS